MNLKRYGLILIYSIVLMGTDKMTGQKVWENSIPHLFRAVQTDLGSDLSQELKKNILSSLGKLLNVLLPTKI